MNGLVDVPVLETAHVPAQPVRVRSLLQGIGGYLPERIVTNAELAARVDTSDAWIVERTGIRQRHVAGPHETCVYMATKAARAALADASATPADVNAIIVATATPDQAFPATAVRVQAELGCQGFGFDLSAACSGFIYALSVADSLIRTGAARTILLIGAETMSRLLDWSDRTTCVLFGDGAGAIVLEAREGQGTVEDRGLLTSHLRSDGRHREKLYVDGGPSTTGTTGHLRMAGKEVFRHAVGMVTDVMTDAFAATG